MALIEFLPTEIDAIKKILDIHQIEIVLRTDWGSNTNYFRESIHGDLKKQMARAYPFSDSSISHSPNLGGYVFTTFNSNHVHQIGFDIEETSRVKPEAVKRVSFDATEFESAPNPTALWVAKESSFKCLKGPKQPKVLSEIEIGDWKGFDSQFDTTLVKNAKKFGFNFLTGCVLTKIVNNNSYHFCIFIAKP